MKHLIKIESVAHGVLGVRHAGNDGQYCEAGETVVLNWQPDAGWGLKEAYYKDAGGNVTPISLIPTKINGKDVATLNNSENTFQNNASCASLTVDAETPPMIASSTITGLKADCVIYVPAASVDAYKAKQYWSARAAYIQAKP